MRQLISRLLRLRSRSIANANNNNIRPLRPPSKGAKSLRKQLPPSPVFSTRSRSILLDELNPITKPKAYRQHKTLPPQVRLPESQKTRTVSRDGTIEDDVRREMTAEEREWWANPYLRMLSTPLRKCAQSSRYLPSDFMVRLSVKRLLSPQTGAKRPMYTLVPDGVQHPKFKILDSRKGHYVVCRRAAMQEFDKRGAYRRLLPATIRLPSSLSDYIGHLLRLRVLQELELLIERLQARPQGAEEFPLLRRLTWKEFLAIRTGKPIEDQDAVAVLVVPPLNRDPATKERPVSNTSPLPEPSLKQSTTSKRHPLPPSTMCYALTPKDYEGLPDVLTPMKVPLYNSVSLFPSRGQRAALHERLCKLLMIERRARWRQYNPTSTSELGICRPITRCAASPAFLLRSGAETVLREDTVPIAIALWRLRMWEGDSWERGEGMWATIL
ncbi:hypothetical protein B0F90DRAFT_1683861 [Multifurca ochricompacta]|uniref:Uncharacterized protein n=1 Tax=Multifurca ochricompacta TaxID=376703 RepID=A0AAD4MB93_9AGAM|nr:hypothetical protein B0F90DRAFT_1683861 [Multifurca ochricompacta]